MKLGLYGGSFDPVHLGHLLVAQAAREELGLDRIVFLPAFQSPFKPDRPATPGATRLQLLRLALAGCTYGEVDDQELRRGGPSYTIETVRNFRSRHLSDELFYLIGADHTAQLAKWRDAAELASCVTFVVIPRPGEHTLPLPPPFRGVLLSGFPLGVSSSQIRERVRAGLPIDLLTGPVVAEAIRAGGLYRA
jgi:nicotinate-nucleotide adenylyltransferase